VHPRPPSFPTRRSSDLSRLWERQHDQHVAGVLLNRIRPEFTASTWEAFQRVVVEGRPAAEVAAALELTPNAVMIAKSRVLARLRSEEHTSALQSRVDLV